MSLYYIEETYFFIIYSCEISSLAKFRSVHLEKFSIDARTPHILPPPIYNANKGDKEPTRGEMHSLSLRVLR